MTADALSVMRSWYETWNRGGLDAFAELYDELIPAGELVVSRMDWQVRGRVSGIDTRLALTNVNAIEDGRIVSQQHYLDHDEALAAAGLSR